MLLSPERDCGHEALGYAGTGKTIAQFLARYSWPVILLPERDGGHEALEFTGNGEKSALSPAKRR